MIKSEIKDDRFVKSFERIIKGTQNAAPLMQIISGIMMDEVEENFDKQGRPAWAGLHPGTIAARRKSGNWPGKILQRSGQLASSIDEKSTGTTATVGTNKEYAAAMQFGVTTKPHVIRPRNKKALAFGGKVVKSVNHPGSKIPARPFLAITESGSLKILSAANNYLRNLSL